jgi:hypothetical protein
VEITLSILIAIGLAAACGFRVFIPFLIMSIAAMSGHLTLTPTFEWIGTMPALIAFGAAAALEIAAYYIPWLDNLLDTIATPAAIVAGVIVTASVVVDVSPLLRWTLAVVAGGGIAGAVQAGTVALRGASTATTGGVANPVVSTGEAAGSAVTGTLAVIWPVAAVALVVILLLLIVRLAKRLSRAGKRFFAGHSLRQDQARRHHVDIGAGT